MVSDSSPHIEKLPAQAEPLQMAPPATSAITMALASPSPSIGVRNPTENGHSSAYATKHAALPLTPPNSVSPNLPAHVSRGELSSPPPIQIDGDVGLQDAADHAAAQHHSRLLNTAPVPLSKGALSGLDASESITSTLLAKQYLPAIMLGQGSMAIRNVTACLTQTVPGFSRIPPAKARRLIVAALESRNGGGPDGSVEFEKVGWGRWGARYKGQPNISDTDIYQDGKFSPPMSEPSSYAVSCSGTGLLIPKARGGHLDAHSGQSWTGSSVPSNFDETMEDMNMAEHEADKMSLDGSLLSDESEDPLSDSNDDTEEEDWASMDQEALRKASMSTVATGGIRRDYNLLCIPSPVYNSRRPSSGGGARSTLLAKSAPQARYAPKRPPHLQHQQSSYSSSSGFAKVGNDTVTMDLDQTSQEREAIEALLRMGST
ncbi:DNA-binding proteins Bright/BRCAA1/RBP1 and proteins containing BRIGHT domain [Taxawa tesnikishii (nom. ined.)]|nr:DNA-binding proteins Bright/BRCAA1/RBP1 and proteins containing BRIGHT domain [Dothideales sp. JES 119]